MEIRAESVSDGESISNVHRESFPTDAETQLVNKLRDHGDVVFSLVAFSDDKIIGHALFSKMQSPKGFLGLAPVAVLGPYRKQGIAEKLIREGLARAKVGGWKAVFVLGGIYYERFGFDPLLAEGFKSPYAGPHLMVLPLISTGLAPRMGVAEYPRAFSEL